ncbi:probable snq2-abc transporter involved in multidrug resistance [Ceraceosorus bombacis]|uniref:Probable snq2-abc transporter involved in multidrug resistance n=1 Tax=Ceraceosorus bombacis TaxID=401625 RepID=A0A0P1BCL0_9BASI|nr:probable snq2-abc transporter involved in multidrug resistance [Ceraceosorus bombacis]
MTLVLGRPGSGCSTFLKTIANERGGYIGVNGEVTYGGMPAKLFTKRYPGEIVYNEEDDRHFPTLTVGETLETALRLKSPGRLLPGESKKEFREKVVNMLLSMLNIRHTRDTKVGDAYVRGVSGGERKRVSVAEMLCTRAAVLSWDGPSRGLDASSALDLAKSLRILTDVLGLSTFVSLYQAGEGIYEQFNNVMVITEGRCVYYGPREQCRPYFWSLGYKDLPRQTSADYVAGCTDKYVRVFADGRDASNVPSTPEALEAAYQASDIYRKVIADKDTYKSELEKDSSAAEEFRQAVMEDKNHGVGKKSRYTVNYLQQVKALWIRQVLMILNDRRDLVIAYITSLILALVIGSLFYQIEVNAAGAFTRGGVIFITLLFGSLSAFAELPTQMGGRPILFRQSHGFAFYRPSALTIAHLAADFPTDFPTGIPKITMFVIIIYFMAGLRYTAGAFFTFWIHVILANYTFRALFSLFGTVCRSYDVAARLAASVMSGLVLFAGYVLPRDAMPRWLFWISYLNPIYYFFEALMLNEFRGLDLACDAASGYLVPSGYPQYNNIQYQTCTLQGADRGQTSVRGIDYLHDSFGFELWHQWLNLGIEFIFFFGFTALTAFFVETMEQGSYSSAIVFKKKPNAEEQKLNARLSERRELVLEGKTDEVELKAEGRKTDEVELKAEGRAFTWENLSYTVPVKGGQRQLLDNINGYCVPGSLTALMGASGAGKTTLLDVLADRKSVGKIEGDRLVEGRPVDTEFQRACGYAEQQDLHEPTATVREALRFSAYLRQDYHTSEEEKNQYVEDIIELMEMQDIADAMIGWTVAGLSVADRKRVTIGVELAAKPNQLLFLDEPTSGLDGASSMTIVRLLRKLTHAGMTILCTIHQPSSLLFEHFDRLLLLERGIINSDGTSTGGRTVYFGDIGTGSQHLIDYFEANGAKMPADVNPAEAMLDIIGAGSQKRVGPRDWADIYNESELNRVNLEKIQEIKRDCLEKPTQRGQISEYATPFMYQIKTVANRTFLVSWRTPDYQFTRLFQHGAFALFTGLVFLQLGNNVASIQFRIFGIFMTAVLPAIILASIGPMYIIARSTFLRENSSKMYTPVVFALTQMMAEIPYGILCAVVYFLLFYFVTGFQSDSNRAGYFFALLLVLEFFSIGLGQAMAALTPSIYVCTLFIPFIVLTFSLFCGVTIVYATMTPFWRAWLYWLNPLTHTVGGFIANELQDLRIRCDLNEFAIFDPPSGQTCQAYAADFLRTATGYLDNPGDSEACRYCQYEFGQEFFAPINVSFANRGRSIGIMIAFAASNWIITVLAAKFTRFANR